MTDASVPVSIGVILDGNRRWAKEQGLPTLEGHRKGYEKVKELVRWARARGIREVVVYAFSTENWNRSPEEVNYLMNLLERAFGEELSELIEEGGRVRFIGQRDRLPERLRANMEKVEEETKDGTAGTLVVALSYGGRPEILAAVNKLIAEGAQEVSEDTLKSAMWSAGLADPDLIIRTSGEQRLSNFLTWQSVYSELFFTDTKWPAFTEEEFDSILAEFATRERRRGR